MWRACFRDVAAAAVCSIPDARLRNSIAHHSTMMQARHDRIVLPRVQEVRRHKYQDDAVFIHSRNRYWPLFRSRIIDSSTDSNAKLGK